MYGVDISEEMVRLTKERAKEFGVDDRIELHCGDAVRIPRKFAYWMWKI